MTLSIDEMSKIITGLEAYKKDEEGFIRDFAGRSDLIKYHQANLVKIKELQAKLEKELSRMHQER